MSGVCILRSTAGATVLLLVLSGCSAVRVAPSDPAGQRVDGVDLVGPWADEFERALDSDVSHFESRVLSDGVVTTAELADTHARVESCLADSGLGIEYDPDGGFALTSADGRYPDGFFERSDPVLRACEARFDVYTTFLFEQTRRNPEKLDDAQITVTCLQGAGLVGADYSARQWRADSDSGELPFPEDDPRWRQCDLDPLGLWRTQ
jgi:hypothetical protein